MGSSSVELQLQLQWRKEKALQQTYYPFSFLFLLLSFGMARGDSNNCQELQAQEIPKLFPCQNYVLLGNTTAPGPECCTPLMQAMSTAGDCFCNLTSSLQEIASASSSINQTRSSGLLELCNIPTPPQAATCATGNSSSSSAPSSSSSGNSSSTSSKSNGYLLKPFTMPIATFLLALPLYW